MIFIKISMHIFSLNIINSLNLLDVTYWMMNVLRFYTKLKKVYFELLIYFHRTYCTYKNIIHYNSLLIFAYQLKLKSYSSNRINYIIISIYMYISLLILKY